MAIVDQRQLLGEWHAICVQFSFVTRWRLPMDPFDFLMAEDLWLPANEAKAGPVDEIDLQSDDDARCTQIKRRRPKRTAGAGRPNAYEKAEASGGQQRPNYEQTCRGAVHGLALRDRPVGA